MTRGMVRRFTLLYLFLAFVENSFSQIQFAAPFTDDMVLQRNAEVAVWGTAPAGSTICLTGSWNEKDTVVVQTDSWGRWSTKMMTAEAGGPYLLKAFYPDAKAGVCKELKNVMLGEVWLCSGQSNMQYSYDNGLANPEKEIPAANYANIRFFTVPNVAAADKQSSCGGKWERCSPETMRRSSAVAYFYARKLHQTLNVPVGVIVSAWGGTNAEVWLPEDSVKNDAELSKVSQLYKPEPWWPNEPGVCYNTMIYPLIPYTIAGFVWYQGESNVYDNTVAVYDRLMRKLIAGWRHDFGKDLPFYFVQIAPFNYGTGRSAQLLREQQAKTALFDNVHMAVVPDLIDGNTSNIHPGNKWDVGGRLADLALTYTYKKDGYPHLYPRFNKMEVKRGKAYITFSDCKGIKVKGKKITDLKIAGEDGIFFEAEAKIEGNTLVVWNRNVKSIKAVRYAFDNNAIGNLCSIEGLPVIPFRTDGILSCE